MFLSNLLHHLKTSLYWKLKGNYQPSSFWEAWGATFHTESQQTQLYPQHSWILKKLKYLKPQSILEVGCGFGRNLQFIYQSYSPSAKLVGLDLSNAMLNSAKSYLSSPNLPLLQGQLTHLPFKSNSFDLLLSHGTLMHLPPLQIHSAISELARVTRHYLLIIEDNDSAHPLKNQPYHQINHYTFTYPYLQLFTEQNLEILESHRHGNLDWFYLKKS